MKAELEPVMRRIQKLLALGQSPNEHEAALAVSKAQELMEEYDLTVETIGDLKADKKTSIGWGNPVISTTEGKTDGWKMGILNSVAASSDCYSGTLDKYERTKSGKLRKVTHGLLIGFKHDVTIAEYETLYLINAIEMLAQKYADGLWDEIKQLRDREGITQHQAESAYVSRTGRHPLKAKLHFTRAAAEAVQGAITYAKRRREANIRNDNPFAVALKKKDAVRDHIYMEKHGKTYDEFMAECDRHFEESRRDVPAKQETDAERRAREAREERERRRYYDKIEREREKKFNETDWSAVEAGQEAGRKLDINPGIKRGEDHKRLG